MSLEDLRDELSDEVSTILGRQFSIAVTSTTTVPHSGDPAITFPNLDADTQGAKLITTCVLYIDIRRSTDLSFAHKAQTVAKLYSAFVRAMTRTARHYGGHVRGIIGDRVMVLFDERDCFKNAVHCAIAMNTISRYIINEHFKANEVRFGIGIDHGKMLATKTGIRRHGNEQSNYRNLVWLGRPANVASKLTDAANKPADYVTVPMVEVAYSKPAQDTFGAFGLGSAILRSGFGSGLGSGFGAGLGVGPGVLSSTNSSLNDLVQSPTRTPEWTWRVQTPADFLSNLEVHYSPNRMIHKDPTMEYFYLTDRDQKTRDETPPILMTSSVWQGFKKAMPDSKSVRDALFAKVAVEVPGYTGDVYGGGAIFPALKP
jgi:class 3 adenylate cyclase